MVNSVITGLKQKFPNIPTKEQVLHQIRPMFQKNINHYCSSVQGNSDPIAEINEYVKLGKYQSPISDIIFPILCDILNTKITVLEHNKTKKTFELKSDLHVHVPSLDCGNIERSVYVVKRGDHYDTLSIPRSTRIREKSQANEVHNTSVGDPTLAKSSKKSEQNTNQTNQTTVHTNNTPAVPDMSDNLGEETLYCNCRKPYDNLEHKCMLECDKCQEWYHCECVDYTCERCDVKVVSAEKTGEVATTELNEENRVKAIRKQLNDSKSQVSKLEKDLANKCQVVSDLSIRVNRIVTQNNKLQHEKEMTDKSNLVLSNTNTGLENTVNMLNDQLSQLSTKERNTNTQLAAAMVRISELEETNKVLEKNISHEEKLNNIVIDQVFNDGEKSSSGSTEMASGEGEGVDEENNVDVLLLKVNQLKNKLKMDKERTDTVIKSKNDENRNLKSVISAQEDLSKTYAQEIQQLKLQLDSKEAELDRSRDMIDILRNNNNNITNNGEPGFEISHEDSFITIDRYDCEDDVKEKDDSFDDCHDDTKMSIRNNDSDSCDGSLNGDQSSNLSCDYSLQPLQNEFCPLFFRFGDAKCNGSSCGRSHDPKIYEKKGVCFKDFISKGSCPRSDEECWFSHATPIELRNDKQFHKNIEDERRFRESRRESRRRNIKSPKHSAQSQ